MSSISVVQYQNAPQKLNVLQQTQNTNAREIIILRKPQQMIQKEVLVTNTARKKPKSGEKLTNPPPMAVARRNARERNRVKQVNNGFATLRQHIPNFIAAAFESNTGRGGNKKLSKVETLRMAVEYIRSLEDLLSNDEGETQENTSTSTSYSSSTPSSPALTNSTNISYTYPTKLSDDDSNISPAHYRRNYQIFYEDSENLDPIDQNLLNEPLIDTDIDLGNQELSLLNSMHTSGSLSPELYSDSSLSPNSFDRGDQMYIYASNKDIKLRMSPEMMTDIKTEPSVMSFDEDLSVDSKENMIQVMTWWEQQQTRS